MIAASFMDPYVLLMREDMNVMVLMADERGELEEVRQGEGLGAKWLSGSLYEDSNDLLRLDYPEESDIEVSNVLMFLLSIEGGFSVSQEVLLDCISMMVLFRALH